MYASTPPPAPLSIALVMMLNTTRNSQMNYMTQIMITETYARAWTAALLEAFAIIVVLKATSAETRRLGQLGQIAKFSQKRNVQV